VNRVSACPKHVSATALAERAKRARQITVLMGCSELAQSLASEAAILHANGMTAADAECELMKPHISNPRMLRAVCLAIRELKNLGMGKAGVWPWQG